ncbi:MAG TPA: hypothetical protein VGK09_05455 [Rhodocyclaceae bacterium]|jgi:hypothetical protein
MPLFQSRYLPLLALVLLLAASAGLYIPWIDNPLVFDDPNLLSSPALGDYAVMPFSLQPRQFPYFTLGFEQVISNGNLHVSRYVALILHGLNGFLLFLLSRRLLRRATTDTNKATLLAFAAGLLFVVHPVSVYAVGYLIQRTILFATFFLLLSAIQFDKALTETSWRRAIFAGLCYGMAVMSKEHAVTGCASVAGLVFLHQALTWKKIRPILFTFLAACLPIALWVILIKLGYIGTSYEPDASNLLNSVDFPNTSSHLGNWALSAALQCDFFFRYMRLWLWPNPVGMSIDIRPDFMAVSDWPKVLVGPFLFVTLVFITITGLKWQQRIPSISQPLLFSLTWLLSLFLIELSTIRIQEPIVLYRSYLWMPPLVLGIISVMNTFSLRSITILLAIGSLLTAPLAWQRLATFSSNKNLWEEAAEKLQREDLAGSSRIFYNRGVQRLKQNDLIQAREDFDRIIRLKPREYWGYWGRASVSIAQNHPREAEEDLRMVLAIKPNLGIAWLRLGGVLNRTGRSTEAEVALMTATSFGYPGIKLGKLPLQKNQLIKHH